MYSHYPPLAGIEPAFLIMWVDHLIINLMAPKGFYFCLPDFTGVWYYFEQGWEGVKSLEDINMITVAVVSCGLSTRRSAVICYCSIKDVLFLPCTSYNLCELQHIHESSGTLKMCTREPTA